MESLSTSLSAEKITLARRLVTVAPNHEADIGHSRSLCTFLRLFGRPFPLQAFRCPFLRCRL